MKIGSNVNSHQQLAWKLLWIDELKFPKELPPYSYLQRMLDLKLGEILEIFEYSKILLNFKLQRFLYELNYYYFSEQKSALEFWFLLWFWIGQFQRILLHPAVMLYIFVNLYIGTSMTVYSFHLKIIWILWGKVHMQLFWYNYWFLHTFKLYNVFELN